MVPVPVWVGLALAPSASAATLAVGPTRPYTTIADAVDDAGNGDRIEVDAGVYTERPIELALDLDIVGLGGSGGTTWESGADGPALRIASGATVTIEGFTLDPSPQRSMVLVEGALTATDWSIVSATETPIVVLGGELTLTDSVLDGNSGSASGGHLAVIEGSATVVNSDLLGGHAPIGGAIYVETGDLVLEGSRLEGNSAEGDGGAVLQADGTFSADATTFAVNVGDGYGADGGAVLLAGATTFTFTGCDLTDNISDETGGAISLLDDASGTIDGTTFARNESGYGGALYAGATGELTVTASDFTDNHAGNNGGAIRLRTVAESTLTITGTQFRSNTATDFGGAIATTSITTDELGGLVLDDDWFTGNSAGTGGALSVANVSTVDASHLVLCANHADFDGGGARVSGAGSARHEWTNTVFTENEAGSSGGGLFLSISGPAAVLNDAFLGNGAGAAQGGGLSIQSTDTEVVNTLVAWTTAGSGITNDENTYNQGALTVTWSAFFDNDATDLPAAQAGGTGLLFGMDPQLALLSADGDCTNDQPWPLPGSPLIDAGDPDFDDPDGSRSDIGVYGGPQADWSDLQDEDQDGFFGVVDCDDANDQVHPDAAERCNGLDDDCDGQTDVNAEDATTFYQDEDRDGFGTELETVTACDVPDGYAAEPGDCDDGMSSIHPDAPEVCNTLDDDCDDAVDEGVTTPWWPDGDGDGYGAGEGGADCLPPDASAPRDGDCDDDDPEINPDAEDPAGDGLDTNCDGGDGIGGGEGPKEEELVVGGGCGCAQPGSAPLGPSSLVLAGLAAWRVRRRGADPVWV